MSMARRDKHGIQLAVCDLCGAVVDHLQLVQLDVEGLRGYDICNTHPFDTPSFNDMRSRGGQLPVPDTGRQEPIGAEFWFEDQDE